MIDKVYYMLERIQELIAKFDAEFIRFVIVGALNTAGGYVIFLIYLLFMNHQVAYSAAYFTGMVTAYILQSIFVFRQPLDWRKAVKYPSVYIAQYFVGLFLITLFVDGLGIPAELAALINMVIAVPMTFILSRYIIKTEPSKPNNELDTEPSIS